MLRLVIFLVDKIKFRSIYFFKLSFGSERWGNKRRKSWGKEKMEKRRCWVDF